MGEVGRLCPGDRGQLVALPGQEAFSVRHPDGRDAGIRHRRLHGGSLRKLTWYGIRCDRPRSRKTPAHALSLDETMNFVELQIPAKALLEVFEAETVATGMTQAVPGGGTLKVG